MNEPEDGPLLPLYVTFDIGGLKQCIVNSFSGMVVRSVDKARLGELVGKAIADYDFAGKVRQIVNQRVDEELQRQVGWVVQDYVRKNAVVDRLVKLQKKLSAEALIELGL